MDGKPDRRPTAVAALPEWIASDQHDFLTTRASPIVAEGLQAGRSVRLGLLEMVDDRRKEVGWLAIDCLTYLGEFDSLGCEEGVQ